MKKLFLVSLLFVQQPLPQPPALTLEKIVAACTEEQKATTEKLVMLRLERDQLRESQQLLIQRIRELEQQQAPAEPVSK